jgi:hypothetical protein
MIARLTRMIPPRIYPGQRRYNNSIIPAGTAC